MTLAFFVKAGVAALVCATLAAGAWQGTLAWAGRGTVLIASEESRTREDRDVFNRIRRFADGPRDIWMMQQSHQGATAAPGEWERLAIVVDRSTAPATARFYQLKPGALEWPGTGSAPPAELRADYRVSCFMCHSNGPRAIRPQAASPAAPLRFADRVRLAAWNLRIKTYGRVVPHASHAVEDPRLTVPFRLRGRLENDVLTAATCVRCHQEGGWVARGGLTRQNSGSILFMLEKGYMPPPGFALPEGERRAIQAFTEGF